MKNYAILLLILILSDLAFSYQGDMDIETRQRQEAEKIQQQNDFNNRGIELFESSIADLRYKLIFGSGKEREVKEGDVKSDSTAADIAQGLLEEMKKIQSGQNQDAEYHLSFKCVQDFALSRFEIFQKIVGKPGRCELKIQTKASGQIQKWTLKYDMELVDTAEHKNWPTRILGPEVILNMP